MASGSGEGSSGGGGGNQERRYQQSLQGLLQFSAEHTSTTANTAAVLDPEKGPRSTSNNDNINDPELARTNQDKALQVLGLHRFRIAGDGNCLFRAVSRQLQLDQDRFHPMLRKAAVKWMRNNKNELLDWGLLDGEKEISETEKAGVWPGQAAIVALANILGINIAVIQGGDKGDIDIQHICPFETPIDKEQGSIILAYLYNGHYDAVVEEANVANPEFDAWTLRRNKEFEADEALARKLAEEELPAKETVVTDTEEELTRRLDDAASEQLAKQLAAEDYEASLVAKTTEEPKSTDLGFRHVSEVKVNYSRPPETAAKPVNRLPRLHEKTMVTKTGDAFSPKPSLGYTSPECERRPDFSSPSQPIKVSTIVYHRSEPNPVPPPRSKPVRSYSEDDAPLLKLTLYPRITPHEREAKFKPALSTEELKVTRQAPTNNALRERQLHDNITSPTNSPRYVKATSPSARVVPVQYPERPGDHLERRAAVRRREYAQQGSSSSWSHSSSELSRNYHGENERDPYRRISDQNTYYKPSNVPHTRVYTLAEDPAPDAYNKLERDVYRKSATTPQTRVYSLADNGSSYSNVDHGSSYSNVDHGSSYSNVDHGSSYSDTLRSHRSEPRTRLPQTAASKSRDIPVMVLSSPLSQLPSHSRATPAPVTYDLRKGSQRPPQLEPFRRNFDHSLIERSLRRRDFWL